MAIEDKYKEYAKNFGGFTPYNPPDRSYYRDLGYKAYQAKEAAEKAEKALKDREKLEAKWAKEKQTNDQKRAKKAKENAWKIKNGKLTAKDIYDMPADNWSATPSSKIKKESKDAVDPIKNYLSSSKYKSELPSKKESKKDDKGDSWLDNLKGFLKGEKMYEGGFRDKKEGDSDSSLNSIGKVRKGENPTGFDRFINRSANTTSFGAHEQIAKATGDQKTMDSFYSNREFGKGGATDFLADSLGYLMPGVGAYKALNATKAGKGLTSFGSKGIPQRLASEGAKGATIGGAMSGAEVGIREGLNPDDYSASNNLKHIGLGTALGAIGDPALYGAGKALGKGIEKGGAKLLRGDVPEFTGKVSDDVISGLVPNNTSRYAPQSNDLLDRLARNGLTPNNVRAPETVKGEMGINTPRVQENPFNESIEDFNKAVDNQYNYLKDSLANRRGVQQGGIIRDDMGEVVDRYGRISENPQWYQEFYAKNGKAPNNTELRQLAEQQVKNGFGDEYGDVPAWRPKEVEEFDRQINELNEHISILESNKPDKTLVSELNQYGLKDITPENIANAYNQKTWYHGTGTNNLTVNDLDPFVGDHESLFGHGIYLTDDPNIANGYANSRSKRTGTPGIYEANVKMDKVLDLEQPVTEETLGALLKFTQPLDYHYKMELSEDEGNYFSNLLFELADKGETTENIIQAIRREVTDFSHEAGIPTSEFVENFQDLAVYLKTSGYDGITHTGGGRTDNNAHRVLIALDPNDTYSNTGRTGQISKFDINENHPTGDDEVQAIKQLIQALEEERNGVLSQFDEARVNPVENISQAPIEELGLVDRLRRANVAREPFEAISAGKDPGLKRIDDRLIPKNENVQIDNPKELVKQKIDTSGKREKSKWSFDQFMTSWVDDLRPLDKATKDLGGKTLDSSKNPYMQARNARGVSGRAETFIYGGIYNKDGEKVGKPLQEIVKSVEKNMDDFRAYIVSKRTLDYDEKGLVAGIRPNGLDDYTDRQLAEAAIKQLDEEFPHFKQAQKDFVEFNQNVLKEVADSGYYTKKQLENIISENENYVPFNRVQEKKVRGFEPLSPKNRYANLSDPLKRRTGSEKPIINPVESAIKNTYMLLNIAERNKVGTQLMDLIEKAPENIWGRVVSSKKQVDDLTNVLEEGSKQLDDGKMDAVDNLFKGDGNKVYAYRDGKKVEMELQEDLYKAMLSLDSQKQNFFIKLMAVPTKTLRAGAVLSPDFGPVNIFRDQFSAFVNSKYGFVPFVDMFGGMKNVLKKDDVYWKWKNSGGANSVLSTLDREYLQKDIRKLVKESFGDRVKRSVSKGNKRELPIKIVNLAIEPLRKASEITEEATRLGEFKKGLKKGATPKEAAFASRDLIDFNRAGNLGRQYNQVTAFFNAAVQSIDKTARVFKENPKGSTVRAMSLITLPSIVAYMYNKDEEWYKEIPQRDRDLYWHFKSGDSIMKLPKPFELGVMFGTVPERILEFMQTNDPKAFKELDKTIRDSFTPPWLPTALAPWIQVYANKNAFGTPIVPRREQDLLPEDQYGPYQSELSKGLGNLTKKSPRNIEQVFTGYTGGLGRYGLGITDSIAKASGVEKAPLPDRGIVDMPVLNRFAVKNLEGNNQSVNDFYDTLDKLGRESKSAKKNEVSYPKEELRLMFDRTQRDISGLQTEKREILASKDMNGKQKTELIKRIDTQITQLAKIALSKVD